MVLKWQAHSDSNVVEEVLACGCPLTRTLCDLHDVADLRRCMRSDGDGSHVRPSSVCLSEEMSFRKSSAPSIEVGTYTQVAFPNSLSDTNAARSAPC